MSLKEVRLYGLPVNPYDSHFVADLNELSEEDLKKLSSRIAKRSISKKGNPPTKGILAPNKTIKIKP